MADLTCPPFGTGSVDFNALHKAAAKADTQADLAKAIEDATEGGEPLDEPPALDDLNKDELLSVAATEGVDVNPTARKDDIRSAIEDARQPVVTTTEVGTPDAT